jgi:hypothetical protein
MKNFYGAGRGAIASVLLTLLTGCAVSRTASSLLPQEPGNRWMLASADKSEAPMQRPTNLFSDRNGSLYTHPTTLLLCGWKKDRGPVHKVAQTKTPTERHELDTPYMAACPLITTVETILEEKEKKPIFVQVGVPPIASVPERPAPLETVASATIVAPHIGFPEDSSRPIQVSVSARY